MRRIALGLALLSSLLLTTVALAHGGHNHDAKGMIESVAEARLTLKNLEGEKQIFAIIDTTIFMRGETESSSEDVVAGERAVVIYEKKDGVDVAIEIKLGPKRK